MVHLKTQWNQQTSMLNQSHHFLKMLEDVKNTCIVYDKTELGNKTITVCNACTVSRPKFINRSYTEMLPAPREKYSGLWTAQALNNCLFV